MILDAPFNHGNYSSRTYTGKLIVMTNGSASGVLKLDGAHDGDPYGGVLPRVLKVDDFHQLSLMELAEESIPRDGLNFGEP